VLWHPYFSSDQKKKSPYGANFTVQVSAISFEPCITRDTLEDSRFIIDFEKTGVQQLDNWASSLKMTSLFPLKGAY